MSLAMSPDASCLSEALLIWPITRLSTQFSTSRRCISVNNLSTSLKFNPHPRQNKPHKDATYHRNEYLYDKLRQRFPEPPTAFVLPAQIREGDVLVWSHSSPSSWHRCHLRLDVLKPPCLKSCRVKDDSTFIFGRIYPAGKPLVFASVCIHQIFLRKPHLFKFGYLHNWFWVFHYVSPPLLPDPYTPFRTVIRQIQRVAGFIFDDGMASGKTALCCIGRHQLCQRLHHFRNLMTGITLAIGQLRLNPVAKHLYRLIHFIHLSPHSDNPLVTFVSLPYTVITGCCRSRIRKKGEPFHG